MFATKPRPGMCSVCFAPSSLLFLSSSASTFLVIFQNTWNILSHYAILFLFITFSPVLTAVPLSTPKSRGLLWSHWERVCLIPSLRKEKNWTRLGCGGAGAFTPHPHPPMPPPCPTPPPWEGRKPPLHQTSSHCLLFPFHSQLCAVTFLVHTVSPLSPW